LKEFGFGQLTQRFVHLKVTMGGCTPCMHDSLWDSFLVEMGNFLAQMEIFQQRGPSHTGFERVLVVANSQAPSGRSAETDMKVPSAPSEAFLSPLNKPVSFKNTQTVIRSISSSVS
jgi:hypothetical protein